jgi:hypothetical protein
MRALVVVDTVEAARLEVGVELPHGDGVPDTVGSRDRQPR